MASAARSHISRPRIGITGNSRRHSPSWFSLRLVIWLAGGRAVRIMVGDVVDYDAMNGLIISGGDDIHPTLYGGELDHSGSYDRERDEMEIACIRYGIDHQLPLLGICRGHQLINVVGGGTLFSELHTRRHRTSNRRSLLPKKAVFLKASSRISSIIKKKQILVNSLHDQAINHVAPSLQVAAVDKDMIIQAVEAEKPANIVGVQWHPEYLWFLPAQFRIFRWFVDCCRAGTVQRT